MWYDKNHSVRYIYPVNTRGRRDKMSLLTLKNELDRGICHARKLSKLPSRDYIQGEFAIFNPILHRDTNDVIREPVIESELEVLELYPNEFVIERVNR